MDSNYPSAIEIPEANAQLFAAAAQGSINAIVPALKNGADLDATDQDGYTALMLAVMHHHTNIARILLDLSAELALTIRPVFPLVSKNEKKQNVIAIAATCGHDAILPELLARFGKQALDAPQGELETTPLMMAACNGHLKCIQVLLNAGANPLLKNILNHTAFEIALVANQPDVAVCLWKAMKVKPTHSFTLKELVGHFFASYKPMYTKTSGSTSGSSRCILNQFAFYFPSSSRHAMTTRSKKKVNTLEQAYKSDMAQQASKGQPITKKMRRN